MDYETQLEEETEQRLLSQSLRCDPFPASQGADPMVYRLGIQRLTHLFKHKVSIYISASMEQRYNLDLWVLCPASFPVPRYRVWTEGNCE